MAHQGAYQHFLQVYWKSRETLQSNTTWIQITFSYLLPLHHELQAYFSGNWPEIMSTVSLCQAHLQPARGVTDSVVSLFKLLVTSKSVRVVYWPVYNLHASVACAIGKNFFLPRLGLCRLAHSNNSGHRSVHHSKTPGTTCTLGWLHVEEES